VHWDKDALHFKFDRHEQAVLFNFPVVKDKLLHRVQTLLIKIELGLQIQICEEVLHTWVEIKQEQVVELILKPDE